MQTREYTVGDETVYVYDTPEDPPRVFVPVGITEAPRRMAGHDGPILDDGVLLEAVWEGGLVELYHPWQGNVGRLTPREFGTEVVLLERHRSESYREKTAGMA